MEDFFFLIKQQTIGQSDEYTTGNLLDYHSFKQYYKQIATDLSKKQKPDAYPKAIQQINFTENLESNARMFFIIEEAKETVLDFSKRNS